MVLVTFVCLMMIKYLFVEITYCCGQGVGRGCRLERVCVYLMNGGGLLSENQNETSREHLKMLTS